eukprot:CAMPEP_0172622332 /NCGR_PEP_ID=MMETSP1068-20121228/119592_1 /TAXON_ID=35684 /ORGANISM="Pseudopedinella elastica, Strain CCMP716" /LENGTH=108 /DNA_ID=CAMNT_0013430459 /DNA_START=1310 /DNA_END=1636 /DNA_ORIENTATION=-
MVKAYGAANGKNYGAFAITRPDFHYHERLDQIIPQGITNIDAMPPWIVQFGSEMIVGSGLKTISRETSMTEAECCNLKWRSPRSCFVWCEDTRDDKHRKACHENSSNY